MHSFLLFVVKYYFYFIDKHIKYSSMKNVNKEEKYLRLKKRENKPINTFIFFNFIMFEEAKKKKHFF